MTSEKTVLFEVKGRIAFITLNRPQKMNAMNGDVFEELKEAFERYNADDELWCAVVAGNGDHFCVGGDIAWLAEYQAETGEEVLYEDDYYSAMKECKKPVVSAMQGYCMGAGMTVGLAAADVRVAAEDAKFGVTDACWSIAPPYRAPLPWDMSLSNALYLSVTGKIFSGQDAKNMGLVNEVVPREKLLETATALAEMICNNAPISVRAHKEYFKKFMELPGGGGDALAQEVFQKVWDSEDAKEGPKAFAEKRKPVWKNK